MRINILLCDTFPGLLPSYIESYESMFVKLFDKALLSTKSGSSIEYKIFKAYEGEFPNLEYKKEQELTCGQIYLISGCNKSAYDEIPWIKSLISWIQIGYKIGIKMVGICFGHQVISMALGGKVERFKGGWGVGIRSSEIVDAKLMEYLGTADLKLLYNHHDQVVSLPQGAKPLAQSSFCRYEGFRIEKTILTFQGHPEYIPEYERHLLLNHSENEDAIVKEIALKSLETSEHQGTEIAKFILYSLFPNL